VHVPKSKKIIIVGIISVIIAQMLIYISYHYARENYLYSIKQIPQNAFYWVHHNTQNIPLIPIQKQQAYSHYYLRYYFSPWTVNRSGLDWQIPYLKNTIQQSIHEYIHNPGYGINHLPNTSRWVEKMADRMDLSHFPNSFTKAITVENTNIRTLPTHQPSFGNFDQAGQGYPFDNLQVSSIAANTPALIIQKTKEGAWSFIIIHNLQGWVPTSALAVIDEPFIQRWKTKHYIALTKNKINIKDHHLVRFTAGVGKIFPLVQNNSKQKTYSVYIAVPDSNQHAKIKIAQLDNHDATVWPLSSTPHHIAKIMNVMMGVKYGWGGVTDDSDCSLTTMNLFSTFGLWLPRNSTLQADTKSVISLQHLSAREKEKLIIAKGIPLLTLLHMPGHIVVYLGSIKGRVYVFQTVWGVETRTLFGKSGRAIIGKTVIAPADLGAHDFNVKHTWLDRMDKMRVLAVN